MLTRDVLVDLFPALGADGPYIEIRAIAEEQRAHVRYCRSIAQALAVLGEFRDTRSVLFGPAARRVRGGTKHDLAYVSAYFADVDAPTREPFPIAPSVVVASGTDDHEHRYWLLDTPQPLCTLEEITAYEAVNKGIAQALGADHCWDASHMLRLPGSYNAKHGRRAFVNVKAYSGQWYSADAFAAYAVQVEPYGALEALDEGVSACPGDVRDPWAIAVLSGGYAPGDDRSRVDWRLCRTLGDEGFSAAEIWALLRASPLVGQARKPRAYWLRTISKARGTA